jgi:hypothetical protein
MIVLAVVLAMWGVRMGMYVMVVIVGVYVTVVMGGAGVGLGVGAVVEDSDEGDDRVGDEVLSEKSSSSDCRYVGVSVFIGLVFRVCVLVRVRVRVFVCELRVVEASLFLCSVCSSRADCWSVEVDWERERVWERVSRVVTARMGIDPL